MMADANQVRFTKRLAQIERSHSRLGSGYVRLVERNGLLVPVQPVRTRRGLPVRGLMMALAAFLLFKGFLVAHLGSITYEGRVGILAEGNIVEQAGAWAMRADPITLMIADQLKALF